MLSIFSSKWKVLQSRKSKAHGQTRQDITDGGVGLFLFYLVSTGMRVKWLGSSARLGTCSAATSLAGDPVISGLFEYSIVYFLVPVNQSDRQIDRDDGRRLILYPPIPNHFADPKYEIQ